MKDVVEGLDDLLAAFDGLSEAASKGVLRRVGRQALQPFDAAWRAGAPELTHTLEESGDVGSRLSRTQRSQHTRESEVEIFAGPGPNPQAVQQEFGNGLHAPQPFMRPAWEAHQEQVLDDVGTGLWTEVEKAAERGRRKLARAALKAGDAS